MTKLKTEVWDNRPESGVRSGDREGYFGEFGGAFAAEILQTPLRELKNEFMAIREDAAFWHEFHDLLENFSNRPTPLTLLQNVSEHLKGARIVLKREDLNHTGSHKLNNVIGQALLARRMGKTRIIAETGAGQHGIATATVAARFGMECRIYMGEEDIRRQYPNVFWMEELGAEVVPVKTGTRTLKDAINDAYRDWSNHYRHTTYILG
nr:pyridoxal-phosphate dependent enzyme [Candidatus Delongbacteria bacterium]